MLRNLALPFAVLASLGASAAAEPATMKVVVRREKVDDGLVVGRLLVDGKDVGPCYENDAKKIPAGTYKGVVRTTSAKNFVQGPGGRLGKTGDFLLEVAGVKDRTDILFHAGSRKEHSEGCILCGPPGKDVKTGDPLSPEPLKKLRLAFFGGTDAPAASPNKAIEIAVEDAKK